MGNIKVLQLFTFNVTLTLTQFPPKLNQLKPLLVSIITQNLDIELWTLLTDKLLYPAVGRRNLRPSF